MYQKYYKYKSCWNSFLITYQSLSLKILDIQFNHGYPYCSQQPLSPGRCWISQKGFWRWNHPLIFLLVSCLYSSIFLCGFNLLQNSMTNLQTWSVISSVKCKHKHFFFVPSGKSVRMVDESVWMVLLDYLRNGS